MLHAEIQRLAEDLVNRKPEYPMEWLSLVDMLQALAAASGLTLVSPAVAIFHPETGSRWLDEFFGNCSALAGCEPSRMEFVAIHDFLDAEELEQWRALPFFRARSSITTFIRKSRQPPGVPKSFRKRTRHCL